MGDVISIVHLTTNSGVISVQDSFTIDKFLQVRCYHHGILVNLSIKSICDMRQISTLIDELSNYTEYNAVRAYNPGIPNPEIPGSRSILPPGLNPGICFLNPDPDFQSRDFFSIPGLRT